MDLDRLFQYINDAVSCTFSDTEYARLHAKRNAAVQIAVATAAFILLMRIFPMGAVKHHTLSEHQTSTFSEETFTAADKKLQTLFFAEPHIYQITLYMQCEILSEHQQESVLFRLYDENFSCIYEEEERDRKSVV